MRNREQWPPPKGASSFAAPIRTMPLVDPSESFDVAARHLFRHLADARRLRRNPLVRRFFEAGESQRLTPATERAALTLIRELIVRAAERYWGPARDSLVSREVAYRRYTIATVHCLAGRPLREVAAQLGISERQCYRERGDVILRIAEYVQNYKDCPNLDLRVILDEFHLRINRAACRFEVGDVDRALNDCEDIVKSDPSPEHKIEALCKRADAMLERGDFQGCETAVSRARDFQRTEAMTTDVASVTALARVALVRSKLSWATGGYESDARALKNALELSESIQHRADDRAKEVHVEILLELCDRHLTRGEFPLAHERLLDVESTLSSVRAPTPTQKFDAMIESWQLGAKDLQFEGSGTKSLSRHEALLELTALTRSFTSPRRSVRLAQAFMQHHADAGDQLSASKWAGRAVRIAQQHANPRVVATAHLAVADWVFITPDWRQARKLLLAAEGAFPEGSPDWILFRGLYADYALHAEQYRQAIAFASEVESAIGRMGNARFQAAARTTIALAAHALGKRKEAHEQVHSALEVVDDYGTPWTRMSAYRAAAMITGDWRHRRIVREISQSLRA